MNTFKSILILASLLSANSILAQQKDLSTLLPAELTVIPKPATTANKTTGGTISRLVWDVTVYNGLPFDSVYYGYSGDNSWNDLLQDWKYDLRLSPGDIKSVNYYDANNNLERQEWIRQGKLVNREHFKYQNNRISERRIEDTIKGSQPVTSRYTYDSLGRLTEVVATRPGNVVQYKYTYSYSADGLATTEYSYLDKGLLTYASREDIHYTNGKKSEHIYYNYKNGVWEMSRQDIYLDYRNNKPYAGYTFFNEPFDLPDSLRHQNYYDAKGNLDSVLTYRINNGSDTPYLKTLYAYNSHNQPTRKSFHRWFSQPGEWEPHGNPENRYRYFEFNLGVSDKKDADTKLKLYPVPANNTLTISVDTKQQQPLSIAICHTDGRMVRSWTQPADGTQYKETIDVSSIPAGAYIIRVVTAADVVSKPFNILR